MANVLNERTLARGGLAWCTQSRWERLLAALLARGAELFRQWIPGGGTLGGLAPAGSAAGGAAGSVGSAAAHLLPAQVPQLALDAMARLVSLATALMRGGAAAWASPTQAAGLAVAARDLLEWWASVEPGSSSTDGTSEHCCWCALLLPPPPVFLLLLRCAMQACERSILPPALHVRWANSVTVCVCRLPGVSSGISWLHRHMRQRSGRAIPGATSGSAVAAVVRGGSFDGRLHAYLLPPLRICCGFCLRGEQMFWHFACLHILQAVPMGVVQAEMSVMSTASSPAPRFAKLVALPSGCLTDRPKLLAAHVPHHRWTAHGARTQKAR